MALGSCYTCIKYLMFAFNFISWLLGCAILGVGIWLRVDEGAAEFVHESPKMELFYTLAYVMMAVGFVIMVIGFLGCCGAIRESQCMLATFFVFLFIIFAILLSFGIWAVIAKDDFQDVVESTLEDSVNSYEDNDASKRFMDLVQRYFDCCGWKEGADDYPSVDKIPDTCLRDYYEKACTKSVYEWVENRLVIIAGVAIGVAVVMILGMIFSMVLCCAIRDTVA